MPAQPARQTLDRFAADRDPFPGTGPVAALICEDATEIRSSFDHLVRIGFRNIALFAPEPPELPSIDSVSVVTVLCRTAEPGAAAACLNALIGRTAGRWLHYTFNAEYLFFPFSETRVIGEMLRFVDSERRDSVAGCVIDLYAPDLDLHPTGVDLASACFDSVGYFARDRTDASGAHLDRQLDIFGGLHWRCEEFLPIAARRIDRIPLFRSRSGLRIGDDFRLSEAEFNTFQGPWHRSLTVAMASFRTAKALMCLPQVRAKIASFHWSQSAQFHWKAQQLLEIGAMEPGQWF
jgi:hypothetical protein